MEFLSCRSPKKWDCKRQVGYNRRTDRIQVWPLGTIQTAPEFYPNPSSALLEPSKPPLNSTLTPVAPCWNRAGRIQI